MRETTFLKQNEKKWKEFEQLLRAKRGTVAPDDIAELFIEVTDDLSYARTHYPKSNTTKYLNDLAGKVHLSIVRNKRERKNRFWTFWKYELPSIMAHSQWKIFYSFLVFMIGVGVGVVSTLYDENFLRLILGDGYVDYTLENIRKGDPLGIYGSGGEVSSFLGITMNNLKVGVIAFALGLLCSVGTAWIIFSNAVMVGAFQAFFYQHGLLAESFQVVYIHGTFELSMIVIEGAAGFTLGNAILFPGTFTRLESLKRGAVKGLKIALGAMPFTIAAGFLEGFVTRYTDMPLILSLLIILGSLSIVVFYFVIYPLHLKSRGLDREYLKDGVYGAT